MINLSTLSYQLQNIFLFTVVKLATMLTYVVIFEIFNLGVVYGVEALLYKLKRRGFVSRWCH